MADFLVGLKTYANIIENEFENAISCYYDGYNTVQDAMLYSLKIGGKRIRPIILLEFYKLCGKNDNNALNFAVALEMIHTYSLIHDDLPCMDDDDFRRGKPACHKVYGEGLAVLAGDALLTEAFNYAAKTKGVKPENVIKALAILAESSGVNGMIGGQVMDTDDRNNLTDINSLKKMHTLKTGALIKCAAKIGCILADKEDMCIFAEKFAENIGLAFQIVDDMLDVCGDQKLLGKPIHSDQKNGKETFISLLGFEKCKETVDKLTTEALEELKNFNGNTEFISELALFLASRNF